MFRPSLPILLVACSSLPGCMAIDSLTVWPDRNPSQSTDDRTLSMDDLRDIETDLFLESGRREVIRDQLADTPRGSQIGVHDESGLRYMGTVLKSGPDGVELMNCICQEAIPGPDGQQQCKTSHVPFQSLKTSSITHLVVIAPPPPGFPASDDDIDGTEYSVGEIVNRSGQRQRWGKPPEPLHSSQ